MIFENIDFHNVEEMEKCDKGWRMWRLPRAVREHVNEGIRERTAHYTTGVELRFCLKGSSADIVLQADEAEEAQIAYLYFGSIQGGWQQSSKVIGTSKTVIHIRKPENMEKLRQITKSQNLPFSPEVVRILLPYGSVYYLGAEGEIQPPVSAQLPQKAYLAYGSSITHGSLALAPPYTYPVRIARELKCDYWNFGFAGSAQMEPEMAEYIVSRKDWDFASVEMGINMLTESFSLNLFEERIDAFTGILAKDKRPVFATSLFGFQGTPAEQERAKKMRLIVKKYAQERLIFTDGLDILDNPAFLSQDGVHPSLEGVTQIAERWSNVMKMRKNIERTRLS